MKRTRFVISVCTVCEQVHDECRCATPALTWLVVQSLPGRVYVHLDHAFQALKQK
jgi:hypothetical protein